VVCFSDIAESAAAVWGDFFVLAPLVATSTATMAATTTTTAIIGNLVRLIWVAPFRVLINEVCVAYLWRLR
jgi:hypothetical protein